MLLLCESLSCLRINCIIDCSMFLKLTSVRGNEVCTVVDVAFGDYVYSHRTLIYIFEYVYAKDAYYIC